MSLAGLVQSHSRQDIQVQASSICDVDNGASEKRHARSRLSTKCLHPVPAQLSARCRRARVPLPSPGLRQVER